MEPPDTNKSDREAGVEEKLHEHQQAAGASTGAPTSSPNEREASQAVLLTRPYQNSELIFGLVAAVGTDLEKVRSVLEDRLKVLGYNVTQIRVTKDVIPVALDLTNAVWPGEYERLTAMMDAGDEARRRSGDNSVLALGAAAYINLQRPRDFERQPQHDPKRAYIISSLKHPEEVARLRDIYPLGFYLIGVHSDEKRRFDYLTKDKGITDNRAKQLMRRDADEDIKHGQKVINTFHLSDFFVRIEGQEDRLKQSTARIRTKGGAVYTTTFPCHNCAKHIVAAGIMRVVFIEPYQKSKAAEFHSDSIQVGFADSGGSEEQRPMVKFEPFVGVGPRRFFDLFSIRLGSGYPLERKDRKSGKIVKWEGELIRLRLQMRPASYLDLELIASNLFERARARAKENGNE